MRIKYFAAENVDSVRWKKLNIRGGGQASDDCQKPGISGILFLLCNIRSYQDKQPFTRGNFHP